MQFETGVAMTIKEENVTAIFISKKLKQIMYN